MRWIIRAIFIIIFLVISIPMGIFFLTNAFVMSIVWHVLHLLKPETINFAVIQNTEELDAIIREKLPPETTNYAQVRDFIKLNRLQLHPRFMPRKDFPPELPVEALYCKVKISFWTWQKRWKYPTILHRVAYYIYGAFMGIVFKLTVENYHVISFKFDDDTLKQLDVSHNLTGM